jgi:MtfA peptidase
MFLLSLYTSVQLVILLVFIAIIAYTVKFLRKKKMVTNASPALLEKILDAEVPFYRKLDSTGKNEFEQRVNHFLATTKITGVRTEVEDIDRVLIAASGIIPIFHFKGWEYHNLNEVLLYPESFDHEYKQEGEGRNILGMVGTGAMNHVMILSKHELRQAFINETGKSNTAIHEFVHLLDKSDGDIDGLPEALVDKRYIKPWLQLMRQGIEDIYNDRSDINPYAASNEAEFFAVVSEYFFERPDLLKQQHPQLYELLTKIFMPALDHAGEPGSGS